MKRLVVNSGIDAGQPAAPKLPSFDFYWSVLSAPLLMVNVLSLFSLSLSLSRLSRRRSCWTYLGTLLGAGHCCGTGVVHAKYYRKSECMVNGVGSKNTSFVIDLLAEPGQPNYCGINYNNVSISGDVPIAYSFILRYFMYPHCLIRLM